MHNMHQFQERKARYQGNREEIIFWILRSVGNSSKKMIENNHHPIPMDIAAHSSIRL